MLLLGLARFRENPDADVYFTEIEEQLRSMLIKYGPIRRRHHPEYPFWRLTNDKLWVVDADSEMTSRLQHDDPKLSELKSKRARGRFPLWLRRLLVNSPALSDIIVQRLLNAHFPHNMHLQILEDIGYKIAGTESALLIPQSFREKMMLAYMSRCALSGFSVSINSCIYGLDIVFLHWIQSGGTLTVDNAIVANHLYAVLFDAGILTLDHEYKLQMSSDAKSTQAIPHWAYPVGRTINLPKNKSCWPAGGNIAWHNKQVFKQAV